MGTPPLVSVVIPTYNRARLLHSALESVAAQDYRPVEVVVVDDASDDGTEIVIAQDRGFLEGHGIALHSTVLPVNSGPAAARNAGLEMSSGQLIAFLASDDLWRPEFLSTLVGLLDRHPTCGVAFSGDFNIDGEGNVFASPPPDLGSDADEGELSSPFENFLEIFPFITAATLVKRNVLDTVGWFDETLASWEDADLWYRIAKQFDFAYNLSPLAYYRFHDGNITKRRLDWYEYQLRVRLRHLDDVRDPAKRVLAVEQIQLTQVLLQEQLLRERRRSPDYEVLLDSDYAPTSARYRAGRIAMQGPSWVGSSYAAGVRAAGNVRRRREAGPATAVPTSMQASQQVSSHPGKKATTFRFASLAAQSLTAALSWIGALIGGFLG
jgi:glycosyltransferase involved in cell wall biosynthesis